MDPAVDRRDGPPLWTTRRILAASRTRPPDRYAPHLYSKFSPPQPRFFPGDAGRILV